MTYHQITFGGCGFLLPYHFGAVLCLLDNDITVVNAVGISGGAMAALAMLRGSDLYVGIRQSVVDLVAECGGLVLCGFNPLFMNFYFKYMWAFRCAFADPAHLAAHRRHRLFALHDMGAETRLSAAALSGRLHVLLVSLGAAGGAGRGVSFSTLRRDEVPRLTGVVEKMESVTEKMGARLEARRGASSAAGSDGGHCDGDYSDGSSNSAGESQGGRHRRRFALKSYAGRVMRHVALTQWECDGDIVEVGAAPIRLRGAHRHCNSP